MAMPPARLRQRRCPAAAGQRRHQHDTNTSTTPTPARHQHDTSSLYIDRSPGVVSFGAALPRRHVAGGSRDGQSPCLPDDGPRDGGTRCGGAPRPMPRSAGRRPQPPRTARQPRSSGRPRSNRRTPPRRRSPGQAAQDHPADDASGWFSATTSNRPGGSLRNAAQASASARLSKGPCSSIVARSTTVNSGSHRGMPRKWLDRSYDFRAHSGQRLAPWLGAWHVVQRFPARMAR